MGNPEDSVASICIKWWKNNLEKDDGFTRNTRARLRRCSDPIDALLIENVYELGAMFQLAGYKGVNADCLALIAIGISHVQVSNNNKLAEIFGRRVSKDGLRILSEQRFQTLIRTTNRRELILPLRRALTIVRHHPINVAALASDLFYWNDNTRISWCFQYFGASTIYDSAKKEINK